MSRLAKLATYPYPLRLAVAQKVKSRLRGFSREHYYVCLKRAVEEAMALKRPRLTVIEFGVAAGRGLIELERICLYLEARNPIRFDIYGFDSGKGLPKPTDYRDTPWKWSEGWYEMDVAGLKKRLSRAELVLGDVAATVPDFLNNGLSSPIGSVMFDLDYYSSTIPALKVFADTTSDQHLPRALCYFDDLGTIEDLGVPRAIAEFNDAHPRRKIRQQANWVNHPDPYVKGWKLYEFHNFDHPDYNQLVREETEL